MGRCVVIQGVGPQTLYVRFLTYINLRNCLKRNVSSMESQGTGIKELLTAWRGISGQESTAKSWLGQFSQHQHQCTGCQLVQWWLVTLLTTAAPLPHGVCSSCRGVSGSLMGWLSEQWAFLQF